MRKWRKLFWTVLVGSAIVTEVAFGDTCGAVSCSDLTGDKSIAAVEKLMRSVGTDCLTVKTIKMLDQSRPGVMHLYSVKCHDGETVADYQVVHEPVIRLFRFDKHSGAWMGPIRIQY